MPRLIGASSSLKKVISCGCLSSSTVKALFGNPVTKLPYRSVMVTLKEIRSVLVMTRSSPRVQVLLSCLRRRGRRRFSSFDLGSHGLRQAHHKEDNQEAQTISKSGVPTLSPHDLSCSILSVLNNPLFIPSDDVNYDDPFPRGGFFASLRYTSAVGARWFRIHLRPNRSGGQLLAIHNKLATISTVSRFVTFPDILLCWVCANCRRAVRSSRDSGNCVPSCSPPVQICSRKYWSPYLWKTRVDSLLALRT